MPNPLRRMSAGGAPRPLPTRARRDEIRQQQRGQDGQQ
jgi:hypothetical protein